MFIKMSWMAAGEQWLVQEPCAMCILAQAIHSGQPQAPFSSHRMTNDLVLQAPLRCSMHVQGSSGWRRGWSRSLVQWAPWRRQSTAAS